jgi:hypothetical protein
MPNSKPNFVRLEGFVDAMVMVEGLRRAGKELTREGLIQGIKSWHNFHIGLGPEPPGFISKGSYRVRSRDSHGGPGWPSGAILGLDDGRAEVKSEKIAALSIAVGGLRLIEGVVGGADQRARLHVLEAHLFS